MFLYQNLTIYSIIGGVSVFAALVILNEITRKSKWLSIIAYIAVPILLTVFVWPNTSKDSTMAGNWFAFVKVYSALAGVVGFMAIRYIKKLNGSKFMYIFPALILSINILEAVYRDYEVYKLFNGTVGIQNGLALMGGPWNLINAAAGLINIITITGWMGIQISNTKSKDMIWPDMLWFWIIAYDLWNLSYCYNSISDRSFYAGLILLAASTFCALFLKKGAWLQHRAQTLALYAMFTISFPAFAESSIFAVKSSGNPAALMTLAIAALAMNVGVLVYQIMVQKKYHIKNSIKSDVYRHLEVYKEVIAENKL